MKFRVWVRNALRCRTFKKRKNAIAYIYREIRDHYKGNYDVHPVTIDRTHFFDVIEYSAPDMTPLKRHTFAEYTEYPDVV